MQWHCHQIPTPPHPPTPTHTETSTYTQTHIPHTIYINNKYKIILYAIIRLVHSVIWIGYSAELVWNGNAKYVLFKI